MPLIVRFFLLFLITGCIAPPTFPDEPVCEGDNFSGVFILNEGVWTQNNARLDLWQGEQLCKGVFEQINDRPLGDVANFALVSQDTLFVVINNSRLLYKIQLPSMELLQTLNFPEGSSPREMALVHEHQAFVTSFHTKTLYEIDPSTMTLKSEIEVENSMEGIVYHEGKVFVACGSHPFDGTNNKLAAIDPVTKEVNYHDLPFENPGDLAVYAELIIVSCRGDFDPNGQGSALVLFDAKQEMRREVLRFEGGIFDIEEVEGNLLVIQDSSIGRLELTTMSWEGDYLPKSQLTTDAKDLIYCMAFDKAMGELYVGLAPFGAVDGEVVRLDPFLREVERKKTGLYPGQIFFYR